MKRWAGIIISSLLIVFLVSGKASAQRFEIHGQVTAQQNNQPLNKTWVGLYNSERLLQQDWTNEKGYYRLPPHEGDLGQYWLDVRPTDEQYANKRLEIAVKDWTSLEIPITLERAGGGSFILEGRLLESRSDKPVSGAWIGLYRGRKLLNYTVSGIEGTYLLVGQGTTENCHIDARPVRSAHKPLIEKVTWKYNRVTKRDFHLEPLPNQVKSATPEVVFNIQGQLVVENSDLSARVCYVTLFRGTKIYDEVWSKSDGVFLFQDVHAVPGTFKLLIEPHEKFLAPMTQTIQVDEKGRNDIRLEVQAVGNRPIVQTSFSGEVFSQGGGRSLGWIKVSLLCQGQRIASAWTNDFGQYEILDTIVPEGPAILLFEPLNKIYSPVALDHIVKNRAWNTVSVTLPSLNPQPVVRIRLQGEVEASFIEVPESTQLTLRWEGFPVANTTARNGRIDWNLDLPTGQYLLTASSAGGILQQADIPILIEQRGGNIPVDVTLSASILAKIGVVLLIIMHIFFILKTRWFITRVIDLWKTRTNRQT